MSESAAQPPFLERGLAALPLLIPGFSGLAYLALFNAPQAYALINAGALALSTIWAALGWRPKTGRLARGAHSS